jgi:hypothetical protein
LLTALQTAQAEMDLRAFPYKKPLERVRRDSGEVGLFHLDADMYAATDAGYDNIRLADQNGAEVPYHLRKKIHTITQVVETVIASSVTAFEKPDDGVAHITVRRGEGTPNPVALDIRTRDRNYEKFVNVYGAHENGDWRPLVTNGRIYDFSRYIDVRQTRIELPPSDYTQFRVDIANFTEQKESEAVEVTTETRADEQFSETQRRTLRRVAIKIEDIKLYARTDRISADEPYRRAYASTDLQREMDEEDQATHWTFGTDRQPLVSLSFDMASRNFSRQFMVEARSDTNAPWHRLASRTLYSLDLGGARDRDLTIPLNPPARYPQYRVTVYNEDNASLAMNAVIATGLVQEVLFLPAADATYTVYYGGEGVRPPRYDVSAVLAGVPTVTTRRFLPGDEQENPEYVPDLRPRGVDPKWLFGIAITSVVLLLVWLIARGAGKVEQLAE